MIPHNTKRYLRERAEAGLNQISDLTGVRGIQDVLRHPIRQGTTTLQIPGYMQVQTFTCGFVTAANVLHFHAPEADLAFLYHALNDTNGTNETQVTNALRQYGIRIRPRVTLDFRSLCASLNAGSPIICSIRLKRNDHWIVVYGCDTKARTLFLSGNGIVPLLNRKEVTYQDFKKKWDPAGFGLVCSKGRLREPRIRKEHQKARMIRK
jgi:hypothetical protein